MTEKYQYSPLRPAGQIRLLKLYAGTEADELSGELVHTSLDEKPTFTALSYAWGNSHPRRAMYCSSFKVDIGPSLHSALQHLRLPACDTFVWADALCINQQDIQERSQQVRLMGDIYGAAFSTAIWLGEESDEVKMAFGWLRRFTVACDSWDSDSSASENDSESFTRDPVQVAFDRHKAAAFGHIWALLDRPWFSRKWIVQELVKSQRPMLVVGRLTIPWAMLAKWINFVEEFPKLKEDFMRSWPRPQEADVKVLGLNLLRATLLTRIVIPEKQLLLFLIAKTLEFKCADSRDHVFAMMGIASDADRFDLIDYGSPMEKVCRKLAYASVSDSMSLKLLWSLVYLAPLKRRVRSWVPNIESLLEDREGSVLATQFSVQQYKDYNASGDTVLATRLDDGGDMLMIRGRVVDRVQCLGSDNRSFGDAHKLKTVMNGDPVIFRRNLQSMLIQRCQWLEECLAITKISNTSDEEKVFRDALLADFLVNKERPQSMAVVRSEFSTQIRLYKAMADEKHPFTGKWLSAALASMSLKPSFLLGGMIVEKLQRRFICTDNGRLGWLPPVAQEGDFICVFDGMELPYAIRPTEDGRYLFVGECFILGLMSGEAVDLPGIDSEIIVLK